MLNDKRECCGFYENENAFLKSIYAQHVNIGSTSKVMKFDFLIKNFKKPRIII